MNNYTQEEIKGQIKFHSTEYLDAALSHERIQESLSRLVILLNREISNGMRFNAVAVRGISGMIFAGAIAATFGVSIIVVRKSTRDSHSFLKVEGPVGKLEYIIIDDMVSSGRTIKTICKNVAKHITEFGCPLPVCNGVFLYDQKGFSPKTISIGGGISIPTFS